MYIIFIKILKWFLDVKILFLHEKIVEFGRAVTRVWLLPGPYLVRVFNPLWTLLFYWINLTFDVCRFSKLSVAHNFSSLSNFKCFIISKKYITHCLYIKMLTLEYKQIVKHIQPIPHKIIYLTVFWTVSSINACFKVFHIIYIHNHYDNI